MTHPHLLHPDPEEPVTQPHTELIGPLTPAEWCAFRQRDEDDLLQCCGVTSEFRTKLFYVLRMGGDRMFGRGVFCEAWRAMEAHGFPEGDDVQPLLDKLRRYYIDGEPA